MSETRAEYTTQPVAMTATECLRFETLETQIQDNLYAFRQVAMALIEIHDSKLYRQKYSSFENYLKLRWSPLRGDLSRMQAWRLMEAERTMQAIEAENVTESVTKLPLPANREQLNALNALPLADRPAAYALAVEDNNGQRPTGKQVANVVHRLDFVETDPDPQPPPIYEENYQTAAETQVKAEVFRSDMPKRAFGFLTDIMSDTKYRAIWVTFVSPANPATGKKEYKTKNLRIPFRDLEAQGWIPPRPDCNDEEDEEEAVFDGPNSVEAYTRQQVAKAEANRLRLSVADEAQNAFWGKAEETAPVAEDFSEAGI